MEILLIEEKASSLSLVHKIEKTQAKHQDIQLNIVNNLKDALEVLLAKKIQVVLIDVSINNVQNLKNLISTLHSSKDIPLIICVNNEDQIRHLKSLELDAHDYLCKRLVRRDNLLDRIRFAIETHLRAKTDSFLFQRNLL